MYDYRPARRCSARPRWHHQPAVLTPEECAGLAPGGGARRLDADDRALRWLFQRLTEPAAAWNEAGFQFELYGIAGVEVLACGSAAAGGWRDGLGAGAASERKIGLFLALGPIVGPPARRIEFFEADNLVSGPPLAAGDAVLFPAWMQHRLAGASAAAWWGLAGWFLGPPFR